MNGDMNDIVVRLRDAAQVYGNRRSGSDENLNR